MAGVGVWVGVFVASLAVLVKSSDAFTGAAERIGLSKGVSPFVIGITVVGLGTSLPELMSSILAVVQGSTEIVVGNVVGSNIANILMILGAAAYLGKDITVDRDLIRVDLPLLIGSAFVLVIAAWDGVFTPVEGAISILALVVYLHYTMAEKDEEASEFAEEVLEEQEVRERDDGEVGWKTYAVLVGSIVFIFLGARYTVTSIVEMADLLGIGADFVAVTAVAIGTSLPELVVSVTAARKGQPEIAVGNILGSNIFNALAVMGVPSFIGALTIPATILSFGLPVMVIATLMYFFTTQNREITRWEGATLLLMYVLFIYVLLGTI
jgi:cation:H+ antiporter